MGPEAEAQHPEAEAVRFFLVVKGLSPRRGGRLLRMQHPDRSRVESKLESVHVALAHSTSSKGILALEHCAVKGATLHSSGLGV